METNINPEQARLEENLRIARESGNKDAAVKASAELSSWIQENNPPKSRGYGCREGRRQQAERRAAAGWTKPEKK